MNYKRIFLFFIITIWAYIAIVNFPTQSALTGWDNLHPEYNFALNFKRAIFGVWQEHQGLGHIGGHGYAATLPHTLLLWIMSAIIPAQYLRATFTLLTYVFGAIGAFVLIEQLIHKPKSINANAAAFLGSIYYMLNLGTIQQYYVQLEAFIVHFTALPWLLYLLTKLLDTWNKKLFLLFIIVSFITSTQSFIPPLFIVYMISLGTLLILYCLQHKSIHAVKRALTLLLTTLCIHSYWLLPILHYTATDSSTFLHSYNNLLSTETWIETNDSFGTISNLPLLRGFLWQATQIVNGEQVSIYQPWHMHYSNIFIPALGYIYFAVILIGALFWTINHKKHYTVGFAILFVFFIGLIASNIPMVNSFSKLLFATPLIHQAFRVSFTKIVLALALLYSIFLGYGFFTLIEKIQNIFRAKHISEKIKTRITLGIVILSCLSIFVYSFPVFTGNLFYKGTKIKIPDAYSELFNFFSTEDPSGRIMLLPQGDHWGWDSFRWGYSGSGFLWFGLQQPILERAFSVWSKYNENYFWNLNYALYANNQTLFNQVLDTYDVTWIIVDTSLLPFEGTKYPIYTDKISEFVKNSNTADLIKTIQVQNPQHDTISIYRVRNSRSRVQATENAYTTPAKFSWNLFDALYANFGTYKSSQATRDSSVIYPFNSLFTQRELNNLQFTVDHKNEGFSITTRIPKNFSNGKLYIENSTYTSHANLFIDNSQVNTFQLIDGFVRIPTFTEGNLQFYIPFAQSDYSYHSSSDANPIQPSFKRCDGKTSGSSLQTTDPSSQGIIYTADNSDSSSCYDIFFQRFPHDNAYILTVETNNIQGNPLTLQVINGTSQRTDTTVILPKHSDTSFHSYTLIIPPMDDDGMGYSVRLSNNSIGNIRSVNQIRKILLDPIPYDVLTHMYIVQADFKQTIKSERISLPSVKQLNPYTYIAEVNSLRDQTIILSQSFSPGWLAYDISECQDNKNRLLCQLFPMIFGKQLTEHVLVNNWANGWNLESSKSIVNSSQQNDTVNREPLTTNSSIIFLFWPQFLEFLGFALLPIPLLFLLYRRKSN